MKKFLNFLKSLMSFGRRTETHQSELTAPAEIVTSVILPVTTPIAAEESVSIPVRPLTCVPVGTKGKKVRFVTRRHHLMVAEIVGHNGDGEVFLRRPNHRFGPTFRRVLAE